MTKIPLQRVFETSKLLATDTGQEIQELIQFVAKLGEITIRTLRKGVGITDNLDADLITVELESGVEQLISLPKAPVAIVVGRVFDQGAVVEGFGWYFNQNSEVVVKANCTGQSGNTCTLRLVCFYS